MNNEEHEYLLSLIDSVKYDDELFTIRYSSDKIVFGAFIKDNPLMDKFFQYGTLYKTVIDLDNKIKISLKTSIQILKDDITDDFNSFIQPSENEILAVYYAENAVFRTIILWDILAQIFNVSYGLETNVRKINYKFFFGKHDTDLFVKKINAYLMEKDNTETNPWKGNHTYINELRNKMTHRNSPNITTISSLDFEMRMPVVYLLKRIIEDYHQASIFISELLSQVLSEYNK
jgi:hypothetical protein